MSSSRTILVWGGLALALLGMLYGFYYAVYVEHQTLNQMSGSLTDGFVAVADRNLAQAHRWFQVYGNTKYDYVRQIDAHSHWIGLAMLMIVLGAGFDRVAFPPWIRRALAVGLVLGSTLFPVAVLLETSQFGEAVGEALATFGAALVTIALAGVALGFARQQY